jgi:hypothetical protein
MRTDSEISVREFWLGQSPIQYFIHFISYISTGNDVLHLLTSTQGQEMRVDMRNVQNEVRYAQYAEFIIGPAAAKYKLSIDGFSGDAGEYNVPPPSRNT